MYKVKLFFFKNTIVEHNFFLHSWTSGDKTSVMPRAWPLSASPSQPTSRCTLTAPSILINLSPLLTRNVVANFSIVGPKNVKKA